MSSLAYTNPCYYKAVENMGISMNDVSTRMNRAREIDSEYIRLIRTLPEWMLNCIINDHNNKIVVRDESIIHEILDELVLRILLRDQHDKNVSVNT